VFQFTPIGVIHSCFREKFGIPRQAELAPAARATLELLPPCDPPTTVRGLEGFSHLWLLFVFHGVPLGRWHPTVRPPRLGGRQRLGVFATRSPFRPNPIGLSVVKLERVAITHGRVVLHLAGVDLLDGTPILDIKPYLPYADSIPTATGGFAPDAPDPTLAVAFSPAAATFCARQPNDELHELITQILRQDPRPAYERASSTAQHYGMRVYDYDVHWEIRQGVAYVTEIRPSPEAVAVGQSGPTRPI